MQNHDFPTPWYWKDIPLAPFHIFYVPPFSMDVHQVRERILGSWTLKSLHINGYLQYTASGCEEMIIDLKYIRARRDREEIPLEARKLLVSYSVIDKSSLPHHEKEESYILVRLLTLSKNILDAECIDVSKDGNVAIIRKLWVRI